jgi:CheY-like chemotaxis protein
MKASSKGRIALVVEDDWFVREDIANQFRQEGWMVIEAATGAKALDVLRECGGIDVLVTDIRLADEMTGWDVAEASSALNDQGRGVQNSVSLSKPMSAHDLLLACSKLLATGMTQPKSSQ